MQRHALTGLFATGLTLAAIAPAAQASIIVSNPVERRIGANGVDDDPGVPNEIASSGSFVMGHSSSEPKDFRAVWMFNITGLEADILAAGQITFSVPVSSVTGNLGSFDLYALTTDDDGSPDLSDYNSTVGLPLATFDTSDISAGETLVVDVTTAVQADAAQNWTGFRIQASTPAWEATGDNNSHVVTFNTVGDSGAALTIVPIPEPASLALVGLGGGLCLSRRRG